MLTECPASLGLERPLRCTEKREKRLWGRWQGLCAVPGSAAFLVILVRFQLLDPHEETLAWQPRPGCLSGSLREPHQRMWIKARNGSRAASARRGPGQRGQQWEQDRKLGPLGSASNVPLTPLASCPFRPT